MMEKILHPQHYAMIKSWLLAVSGGSWIGWVYLKAVSFACQILLPITGVFSFLLFIIINFKKIVEGVKYICKLIFK